MLKNGKLIGRVFYDYFMLALGSLITAVALNVFLVPYKIAPGGVSGIATVIYYLSGGKFQVGVTMLVLNIPLFFAGYRFIGGRFFLRTLFGAVLLSLFIDSTQPMLKDIAEQYLTMLDGVHYTNPDLLLYSIFGGVLLGVGLGMVFKSGATTGGSDLGARILNNFIRSFTMGQVLLFIDTSVIIFAAISFSSFELALYSIVTLFISSKVIDAILEGVNFAKAVFIISDNSAAISKKILTDLDRGVTGLKGTGMYTEKDKQVLLCILDRGQIPLLKALVKEEDEKAFVIVADVREVLGEGFKPHEP